MRTTQVALALAVCAGGVVLTDCGREATAKSSRSLPSTRSQAALYVPNHNDVQDVVRGWWTVKQSLPLRYLGVIILMTFLKLYPEYYEVFAGPERYGVEQLPLDQPFVATAVSFAYDFSSMLDNLDDLPLVEEMAKRSGERRAKDGANAAALDDMRDLILHLLARYHKQYAELFPLGIVESSARTLYWIFAMMKKGLQPEGDNEKNASH